MSSTAAVWHAAVWFTSNVACISHMHARRCSRNSMKHFCNSLWCCNKKSPSAKPIDSSFKIYQLKSSAFCGKRPKCQTTLRHATKVRRRCDTMLRETSSDSLVLLHVTDEQCEFRALRRVLRDSFHYLHRIRTSPPLHSEQEQRSGNPILAVLCTQLVRLVEQYVAVSAVMALLVRYAYQHSETGETGRMSRRACS
jgi:hypothetical protein